jgi:hypothetical protein
MTTATDIRRLRIIRATRTSGRGGFPSVWFVWEIHERTDPEGRWAPLLRKNGTPREWQHRSGAAGAMRRLRAAAAA